MMRSRRIPHGLKSWRHSKGHVGHVGATGIRKINAQIKAKAEEREDSKEDMVRRGSRHLRQQANQDSLEEERITKEASMARLRESQAKAKVKDHAGYAMDPICSEIAPKVEGKEADIQARLLHMERDPG